MIAWSNAKLKFTSGIGALCVAGMLADLSRHAMPFWIVLTVAMVPLLIFLFVQRDEMRRAVVLPFQLFACAWYVVSAVIISILFLARGDLPRGWPLYFVGLAVGGIPCAVVLRRAIAPPAGKNPFTDA